MIHIEESWKNSLKDEFEKDYFKRIISFLRNEKKEGKTIYPSGNMVLNSFNITPLSNVKVVILGQDPYHNPGQAHGLSFSVPDGISPPPSLVNIFKELSTDLGITIPKTGNLKKWAKQGVLLLNASLTVEENRPMSHSKIGWHVFTNNVIRVISETKENVVFILWGKFAQTKEMFIDGTKHLVLKSVHPSPLSAYNGFFGCKHFSKTNEFLLKNNIEIIDWSL